jgi:large subunit ribosomal protein L30
LAKEEVKEMGSYIAVRIRGRVGVPEYVEETLRRLRLRKKFSAVILPSSPSFEGMLRTASGFITWGEGQVDGVSALLKRLKSRDGKNVNSDLIKSNFGLEVDDFIKEVAEGKIVLNRYTDLFELPVRLRPPKGGFKLKSNASFGAGGETGYRGTHINILIKRMI